MNDITRISADSLRSASRSIGDEWGLSCLMLEQLNGSLLTLSHEQVKILGNSDAGFVRASLAMMQILITSDTTPNLDELTLHDAKIAQGRVFHRMRAGDRTRRYDQSELLADHDERVTENAIEYYIQKFGQIPRADTVLGWLYHDSVEDYGVSYDEIAEYSGARVAQAVERLTIPEMTVLRELYPHLSERMQLKNQFKADSIQDYTADDIVLKFFDNVDAVLAYNANIKFGQILVAGNPTGLETTTPVFSRDELMLNTAYRSQINRLLVQHCATIANDPEKNPEGLDTIRMGNDFGAAFVEVCQNFTKTVLTHVNIIPLAPARKRPPMRINWEGTLAA